MTNPFTQRIQKNNPIIMLSVMALLLGLMIGLAWVTNQERVETIRRLPQDQATRVAAGTLDLQENYLELQTEVSNLRRQLAEYEKAASRDSGSTRLLQESLTTYKAAAGLTELTGPGVLVTLSDSQAVADQFLPDAGIIHDVDVLRVVNELWASGAEAISINGQRIVAGTAIRCAGPTVLINFVPTPAPIRIQALGDPANLMNGLKLPGGPVNELQQTDPKMVQIEKIDKMTIPAYSGATSTRLGVVPGEDRP